MNKDTNEQFPKVFIITLNWNKRQDTVRCVDSLLNVTYPNCEIVVVDNGSTDDSIPVLRNQYPHITLLENGQNLGYAEGFNSGMRYAAQCGADYFLIINNDTAIDPDALTALVRVAQQDSQIGFVTGKVYFHNEPNRLQTVGKSTDPMLIVGDMVGFGELDLGQYDKVREYEFVDDVFLLVRRSVFEQIGGYDPIFFLMYEETDWCARARRAGFKIMYTPDAKLWHKGNRGRLDEIGLTHQFYLARNQIPFLRRNAPPQHFRRYLLKLFFSFAEPYIPRHVWRMIKIGRWGLLVAYLRGIGSGLLWLWQNRQVKGPVSFVSSPEDVN